MTENMDSALELHQKIRQGELSPLELLDKCFANIEKLDGDIQAFNFLTKNLAYNTAKAVEQKVKAGEPLPLLAGVPLAIKDNMLIKGIRTTCGSKILENFVAPYHATVTQKLLNHHIPIVGKTNLDEFAMGSSTENSAFKVTRNPWDLSRVPGGSSGGSAAAVSSGQVPLALGSDTGGSVRQPASLCGIAGIKPTYGLVSRYGLVAFASSLDQISPLASNVQDLAALLQVIAGSDPLDSTSLNGITFPIDYLSKLDCPVEGLKIGYIEELLDGDIQPDTKTAIVSSIKIFQDLGATVEPVSLPHLKYAIASYYIIATAEASSNLARYDGVRYGLRVDGDEQDIFHMYLKTRAKGFGNEVKRRIMLGTFSLSAGYYEAYYGKAQKVRQLIRNDFANAFNHFDIIICPTSPTTAFKIGEKISDPVKMYLSDIATIPVNLAGIPAISIPCGFDHQNLPIGLQILGPHLSESLLLRAAYAFETATGLKNLKPQYKHEAIEVK